MRSASLLRVAALVLAAALALHELRYLIEGQPAGRAFEADHGYLPLVAIATSGFLRMAAAALVRALARARRTGCADERPVSFARVWMLAAGALVALHFGQELLESALSGGGTTPVAENASLLVVALAAPLGALVALATRGAVHALVEAAGSFQTRCAYGPVPATSRPRRLQRRARLSLLALHLAERAPPLRP